ncbi:hypothetical protein F4778DRAFT_746053 [Xylariomycetidae sp. FL2044]|nr:hypothetical protein F4778DRAFT_746053 [Xylariomycetidae sp. FL2044]
MTPRGSRHIPLVPLPTNPSDASSPPETSSGHDASTGDVIQVREILIESGSLPPEIADIILDLAEYWVCTSTGTEYPDGLPLVVGGSESASYVDATENCFLIRSNPIGFWEWGSRDLDLWQKEATPKPIRAEYTKDQLAKYADGPTLSLKHPARKIVFDITSRDQGWGGHLPDRGTYRSSWTWFDAGVDRFERDHDCPPNCCDRKYQDPDEICSCAIRSVWPLVRPGTELDDDGCGGGGTPDYKYYHPLDWDKSHQIQRNQLAVKEMQHHHVEWRWNDDVDPNSTEAAELDARGRGAATGNGAFVRSLKMGDMVTVWVRARFPGWENQLQKIDIKVYWAL